MAHPREIAPSAQIIQYNPAPSQDTRWLNYFDPAAALESVINHVESQGSSRHERHTMHAYLSSLGDYIRFMGGAAIRHSSENYTWDFTHMMMPTNANMSAYIAHCHRRALSSSTIQRYLASIRHFLQALENQEVMPDNGQSFIFIMQAQKQFQLARNVKNPKADKKTSRPALENHGNRLEIDQIDQLLNSWQPSFNSPLLDITTLTGKRDLALVYLGIISGLRAAELGRLTLSNIEKADDENYKIVVRGKGNKFSPVGIDVEAHDLIQQYVAAWNSRLSEEDSRRITESTPIFQRILPHDHIPPFLEMSKGINPRNISRIVERRVASAFKSYAGATRFTAHDMRRTCAYIMRELKFDWDEIRAKLRHESIATTERYVGKKLDLNKSNLTRRRRFNIPTDPTQKLF